MPFNIGDKVTISANFPIGKCMQAGKIYTIVDADEADTTEKYIDCALYQSNDWLGTTGHPINVKCLYHAYSSPLKKLMNDIASNL